MLTDDQFTRLPKYARDEISRLREKVESGHRDFLALVGDEGSTGVSITRAGEMERHNVPDTAYRFKVRPPMRATRDGGYFRLQDGAWIEVIRTDQGVELHASHQMSVDMRVTNTFDVRLTNDDPPEEN